ncbi:hypothetical protein HOY82DRAFT_576799 [Tuber indicum]|nr:hypothetical protein HOY82DRAFT_576799 [Tuber indicum]
MSLFDGWEELSDEQKDKVRVALEIGHVDDQDWKGDVGLNRKDAKKTTVKAKGKSAPAAKKGKKEGIDDEEEEAVETDEGPAPKKSTKKSAATSTTTTTSKKRTLAKKSTTTPTLSPSASPEPVKSRNSATSKKPAKSAAATEPTRPRSSRATAATPKKYIEVNESADDDSPPAARKSRTTAPPARSMKSTRDGRKKAGKGRGKKAGGDSDTEAEDAEMVLHADDDIEEDAADLPPLKAQSKGRGGVRKRKATAVVGDVQDEVGEEEEYAPLNITPRIEIEANLNTGNRQPKKKRTKAKSAPTKKEQSAKTKKTKTKAKDSAKETPEVKDRGEVRKSIFGGE